MIFTFFLKYCLSPLSIIYLNKICHLSFFFAFPDDIPKEIRAQGADTIEAYEEACTSGTQSVYRARLMLVGQEKVGKTCLRRALLGQR